MTRGIETVSMTIGAGAAGLLDHSWTGVDLLSLCIGGLIGAALAGWIATVKREGTGKPERRSPVSDAVRERIHVVSELRAIESLLRQSTEDPVRFDPSIRAGGVVWSDGMDEPPGHEIRRVAPPPIRMLRRRSARGGRRAA